MPHRGIHRYISYGITYVCPCFCVLMFALYVSGFSLML
nr:MAG TPA: hypothetical protein [Caudoviricetes sp.]